VVYFCTILNIVLTLYTCASFDVNSYASLSVQINIQQNARGLSDAPFVRQESKGARRIFSRSGQIHRRNQGYLCSGGALFPQKSDYLFLVVALKSKRRQKLLNEPFRLQKRVKIMLK